MQDSCKAIRGQVMSEDQMLVIITGIKTKTESNIGIRGMQTLMVCGYKMLQHDFSVLIFFRLILPEICLEIYINQLYEETQMCDQKCGCQPIPLTTKLFSAKEAWKRHFVVSDSSTHRKKYYISEKKID